MLAHIINGSLNNIIEKRPSLVLVRCRYFSMIVPCVYVSRFAFAFLRRSIFSLFLSGFVWFRRFFRVHRAATAT